MSSSLSGLLSLYGTFLSLYGARCIYICILQYKNNIALSLCGTLPELIQYKLRRNGLIKLFSGGLGCEGPEAVAHQPKPSS